MNSSRGTSATAASTRSSAMRDARLDRNSSRLIVARALVRLPARRTRRLDGSTRGCTRASRSRHDPRRRAPDHRVLGEVVDVAAKRDPAVQQAPARARGAQVAEAQLEHLVDLARRERPLRPGLDETDDRIDAEVRRDGRHRVQRAEHLDGVARQPDLLLGLAQGGRHEVGVLLVAPPAGKRDLAGVAAQVVAAAGEDGVHPVVVVERDEDGGLRAAVDLHGGRLGGVQQDRAQGVRQRARRARHARRT